MDLRRLRLFLAVVDAGSFTAAATAVHVAQPAVSLAVRELETELGAPLLVRSRRGAHLTPAGEALVGPARQAVRDIENATAARIPRRVVIRFVMKFLLVLAAK